MNAKEHCAAINDEYGGKLAEILGIPRCRDIDLRFHIGEAVEAKVTFVLNNIQAEAVVRLLEGTKWGSQIEG